MRQDHGDRIRHRPGRSRCELIRQRREERLEDAALALVASERMAEIIEGRAETVSLAEVKQELEL